MELDHGLWSMDYHYLYKNTVMNAHFDLTIPIAVGADHAGYDLKETLKLHLQKQGVSVADAVRIAAHLLESDTPAAYTSGQLTLVVDLRKLERDLNEKLTDVLESAPAPRRGRPPTKPRT